MTSTTRRESNEALGSRLLKEKADAETIERAFIAAYADAGKTDLDFIRERIKIYMKIAKKRLGYSPEEITEVVEPQAVEA